MKVCAVEIDSNRLNFCVLEKKDNEIIESTGKVKFITLDEDHNHSQVLDFIDTVHSHFNSSGVDKIVIISRITSGRFSSSGISFKLEGLIQAYKNKPVEFVSPKTLSAYYRKHPNTIAPKYKYQKACYELAFYILNY